MANPAWPTGLPPMPLTEGLSYTPPDNIVQDEMDAATWAYPRRTGALGTVTCRLILRPGQLWVLQQFHQVTLRWVRRFDWVDFQLPLHPSNVATYSFIRKPQVTARRSGMTWLATLDLRIHARPSGVFLLDISNEEQGLTT